MRCKENLWVVAYLSGRLKSQHIHGTGGHIVGQIPALKPCYVPGIHGPKREGHTNDWFVNKWAMTWDFQQCGMCDQQMLKPACAYAKTDQSLC